MATHSSIPAWRIPWTEEPCRLQSMGLQELDTTKATSPLPYSLSKVVFVGTDPVVQPVWGKEACWMQALQGLGEVSR